MSSIKIINPIRNTLHIGNGGGGGVNEGVLTSPRAGLLSTPKAGY